ncbi:MAG: hypothetical protein ACHQPI_04330 [Thermoanaerobaculia bacterium]
MTGVGSASAVRARAAVRDVLVFLGFAALTCAMTWPWVARIRTACADTGDSYMEAWVLWWDYHATVTGPLHLFNSNIFYPYHYTLAFTEHCYGIALPFFPLFALGLVTPLSAVGVAMLLSFALSGFGAFRLIRTLTGSTTAAWVAGIAFGFASVHVLEIYHLVYAWAVWIPLLAEALILFVRKRTWARALWLGVAFLLNGLSVIHWMALTALPLALTAIVLGLRHDALRDRALWIRGGVAVGLACLLLVPFLLPYAKVTTYYGMTRDQEEVSRGSARFADWLHANPRYKLWAGFQRGGAGSGTPLFPGALSLLLAVAALLLARKETGIPEAPTAFRRRPRGWLAALDAVALGAGLLTLFPIVLSSLGIAVRGLSRLKLAETTWPLAILAGSLVARWCLAYPKAFRFFRQPNLIASLRGARRPEALSVGLIWLILGFFGSLGLNFPFHRFLFETVALFRSIRVPLRWAMVGALGLAVLAGLGAVLIAKAVDGPGRGRRLASRAIPAVLCLALLFELRVAPLDLMEGEPYPDEATRYLASVPMRGGLVEIPAWDLALYRGMLRAADHGKPLITAISGFVTPTAFYVGKLLQLDPIPPAVLDLLEDIPTSYVVVRRGFLEAAELARIDLALGAAVRADRLRFVRRFPGRGEGDDLYLVMRTEPGQGSAAARPPFKTLRERLQENPAGGDAGPNDAPRNVALPSFAFKAEILAAKVPSTLRAGETVTFDVKVTNLGDRPWPHTGSPGPSFAVLLSYHWFGMDGSVGADGLRTDLLLDLPAGESITLNMSVQAPNTPGDYLLELDMVQEAVDWFKDRGSKAPQFRVRVE